MRVLTDTERAQLANDGSIEGFALEADFAVGAADTVSVMALRAARGSLLTSEWYFSPGYYGEYPYETGGFWELYNNADTTVYLDGMVLGNGRAQFIETQVISCAESERDFLPADGVWVLRFDRFPGAGRDHPVQPGQAVVIAGYAIDHSEYFRNALDLRVADFEFGSPSGVDNPDVPNLTWLGPERMRAGQIFLGISGIPLILLPLDPNELQTQTSLGSEYRKAPGEAILDVFAWRYFERYGTVPCRRMLHPSINVDIEEGGFGPDFFLISTNRRVLYTRPDGRKVLLHTKSSRTDFVDGARTPGVIP